MRGVIGEDLLAIRQRITGWDRLKGRTVLIASAGSLIGGTTALSLLEANRALGLQMKVVCLVRTLSRAKTWFSDFSGDDGLALTEADLSRPLACDGDADIIIHSGGSSSPWAYANDPVGILKSNVAGGLSLLDLARKRNTESFLFFSSREVYGHPGGAESIGTGDLGVMDHLQLRNVYPESKKMMESALVAYGDQYGVPWRILRIASVYGPGMKLEADGRAISDFVNAAIHRGDIRLNSDGRAIRSYCYTTDAVAGILTILLSGPQNQVFNLANETQQFSIRETAQTALAVGGGGQLYVCDGMAREEEEREGSSGSKPQYSPFAYVPMDVSALESLGWRPRVGLKEGLERTVAYFRG